MKGILTLRKSGTHLLSNILKTMQKLGYMNLGKWKNSGFYFGHILDDNNLLHLTSDQIAFITIRDPRGFFILV